MKRKSNSTALLANRLSVKEYGEADFTDLANLLWTNIGLKTSLTPLHTLLLTNVVNDGEYSRLNTHLAEQIVKMKKSVLILDLDRGASALKKKLPHEPALGVTDFFYKLFEEPFFSSNASDYGFWDLIILAFLKKRSGKLVLISDENDPVHLELYQGYPLDVLTSKTSLRVTFDAIYAQTSLTKEQRVQLFDAQLFKKLTELSEQHYFSFAFQDKSATSQDEEPTVAADTFARFSESPHFLKAPLSEEGYISHSLRPCSQSIMPGVQLTTLGQFRLKGEEFAKRCQQIMPLLKQKFDFILCNAPALASGNVAKEMAKVLDGTVLVLKSGAIERKDFKNLLTEFKKANINVIGTILNEVAPPYQSVF